MLVLTVAPEHEQSAASHAITLRRPLRILERGTDRWSGPDRYSTATDIATNAVDSGWLSDRTVGVAAKLPDALTGGAMVGCDGGPLVITDGANLTSVTGSWLSANKSKVSSCYVFGGEKSMTPRVRSQIEAKLK